MIKKKVKVITVSNFCDKAKKLIDERIEEMNVEISDLQAEAEGLEGQKEDVSKMGDSDIGNLEIDI